MRLPAAFLLTPALVAQAPVLAQPDPAQILPRIRQPLLFVFAPPPAGKDLTQAQLAVEDDLEGVYLQTPAMGGERPEIVDYFKNVRVHLKLTEARWALVLKGRVLAQGGPPLTLPALKALAQSSGFLTPTQELRAFLKRRPDHLEARLSLLQQLRQRAEVRTRQALGSAALAQPLPKERGLLTAFDHLPKADARLKPEDDLRIWGETYRELDRVLQNEDWLCMTLDQLLGESRPLEAASPLMRGLYQRHRPQILATVRETPQDRNALCLWAYTSVVLGEPLAPFLESLTPPPPPTRYSSPREAWPGEPIRKLLACEARRQQDWPRLARLLSRLWLDGQEQRGYNPTKDMQPWQNDWRAYGLPALEAQIRAGIPEAAQPLLDSLTKAPDPAALRTDAVSLARRLGREDLALAWQQPPSGPQKPEGLGWEPFMLVTTSRNRSLLWMNNTQGLRSRTLSVHSLHPEMSRQEGDTQTWRRFLGWGPQDQRWAVLDQSGHTLLEGAEPMDQAQVQKALDALNLTWDPQPTPSKPLDLWSRTEGLVEDLQQVIQEAKALTPPPSTGSGSSPESDPTRMAACLQRLRGMDDLLEGGLWQRSAHQVSWSGMTFTSNLAEAVPLARTWTQALEAELVRRPGSFRLWVLWSQWVALVPDPDFSGLEGRLERDPLKTGLPWHEAWPPPMFLSTQIQHHAFHGRWRQLEQLASPQWDKAKTEGETRTQPWRAKNLWYQFGMHLAQALWKQDRMADADRLFSEALSLGLDRDFLARTARDHDLKELAAHWDPPKTAPNANRSAQP